MPTCNGDFPHVTDLSGQGKSDTMRKRQMSDPDNETIGTLGTALGCVSNAKVCESIAWVDQFNLYNKNYATIEFGFGDITLNSTSDDFVSMLPFESLSPTQVDELEDKVYVFPVQYTGRTNGTYFSNDRPCSNKDYRPIARTPTID